MSTGSSQTPQVVSLTGVRTLTLSGRNSSKLVALLSTTTWRYRRSPVRCKCAMVRKVANDFAIGMPSLLRPTGLLCQIAVRHAT